MYKYILEKIDRDNADKSEMFYFDTLEEMKDYINKDKHIFNNGFSSKIIKLRRIEKGR